MAINSEEKIIKDAEGEKRGFVVTFTNGTLEQLEELREHFKEKDKLDVIKLGISLLQRAKDHDAAKKTNSEK